MGVGWWLTWREGSQRASIVLWPWVHGTARAGARPPPVVLTPSMPAPIHRGGVLRGEGGVGALPGTSRGTRAPRPAPARSIPGASPGGKSPSMGGTSIIPRPCFHLPRGDPPPARGLEVGSSRRPPARRSPLNGPIGPGPAAAARPRRDAGGSSSPGSAKGWKLPLACLPLFNFECDFAIFSSWIPSSKAGSSLLTTPTPPPPFPLLPPFPIFFSFPRSLQMILTQLPSSRSDFFSSLFIIYINTRGAWLSCGCVCESQPLSLPSPFQIRICEQQQQQPPGGGGGLNRFTTQTRQEKKKNKKTKKQPPLQKKKPNPSQAPGSEIQLTVSAGLALCFLLRGVREGVQGGAGGVSEGLLPPPAVRHRPRFAPCPQGRARARLRNAPVINSR